MEHATAGSSFAALAYLIAGVCFILALRGLSSPTSSQRGNRFGIKKINLDSLYIGLRTTNLQIISDTLNARQITSDQQEISHLVRPQPCAVLSYG
jgi:NAD/NADP transhydrogenase beta subunit